VNWVAAIPLLPALTFVVLLPMSRDVRRYGAYLSVAAMAASFLLSLAAFARVWPGGSEEPLWTLHWPLATIGTQQVELGLRLNSLSALMVVVVTAVGICVQVYSLAYMRDDARRGWFFAVLSLFTAAMLAFVLADNLLLMFASWEVMGLCSYLLIGFWYELEGPRAAAMKAFLTTRVGDLGFLFALWVVWAQVGSFELPKVIESLPEWAAGAATLAAIGFLIAAMGKSAQIGLHVWLPDAMAGPTPASALIHAATMVAAGVYLVAVTLPTFAVNHAMLTALLVIGTLTTLLGGLLGCVQHDIKKVMAYSTISQLGLMFVGLGTADAFTGVFHLTTHAFFKSLLFLGAGTIIHAAHTQDMREMGGIAKRMPWTTVVFTVGTLALAGVVPMSGFFSKDEIITVLWREGHYLTFGLVLVGAFITAYYVARLWFRVFTGPAQAEHLHEGHPAMLAPMTFLAAVTVVIGFLAVPLSGFLGEPIGEPLPWIMVLSTVVAVAGIGVGWWFYGRRNVVVNTARIKHRFGLAYDVLASKFYFDLTYDRLFVRTFRILARWFAVFDGAVIDGAVNGSAAVFAKAAEGSRWFDGTVIDGAVNGLASGAKRSGTSLRRLQTGNVQSYQRLVVGALVVLLLVVYAVLVTKGA
jgi:NADH-quinone oxidoreductase subunit L